MKVCRLSFACAAAAMLALAGTPSAAAAAVKQPFDPAIAYPDGFCGTRPPREPCTARIGMSGPQARRTLFVNRHGGSFGPGLRTDSTLNTVAAIEITSGVIPPMAGSDTDWALLLDCVRERFRNHNIDVVDIEPPSTETYAEVIVGGTQLDINYSPDHGVGGVASNDVFCAVGEKAIAFAFGTGFDLADASDRQWLCVATAHEAGHLYGLEHEVVPADIMSYENPNLFAKEFVDAESPCGEFVGAPNPCFCSQNATQNSRLKLDDLLGPNEQELPVVTVTSPAPGATVGPRFAVVATATDNSSVETVELWIDDVLADSDTLPPYKLEAPADLALGSHSVEVRAVDKASNRGAVSFQVTVEPGCSTAAECAEGELCVNNACLGDVGHECGESNDCESGICAASNQFDKICTRTCDANASASCPDGFSCSSAGGGSAKCFPSTDSGGCGIAAGRQLQPFGLLSWLAISAALLLMRRRSKWF